MKSLQTEGRRIHHTHRIFMLNMSRAAGEPFEQSAIKWRMDRLGYSGEKMNCQVCNTALNNFVVLVNNQNGNRIIIGHNCYDKLIGFLRSGKVESSLKDRHSYVDGLKKQTDELVNQTVIGWFRQELDAGKIQDDSLARIVSHIKDFGFAPSVENAQRLVDYYKDRRAVFVEKMVPEARNWRLRRFIPNHIRVGYVDRLYALIERSEAIHRDLVTLRVLRIALLPRLQEMLKEVLGMIKYGHQESTVTEELELIAERIEELLGPCNQRWLARVANTEMEELEWWIDQVRPLTWRTIHVYRSTTGRFYLKNFDRVWVEINPCDVVGGDRCVKSGLYEAYHSRYHHTVMVTTVRAQFTEYLRIIKFDTPQPGVAQSFLGRMAGKKVVSVEPVSAGTYLALLIQKFKKGSLVFAA